MTYFDVCMGFMAIAVFVILVIVCHDVILLKRSISELYSHSVGHDLNIYHLDRRLNRITNTMEINVPEFKNCSLTDSEMGYLANMVKKYGVDNIIEMALLQNQRINEYPKSE